MGRYKDLTGQTFGRLTAFKRVGIDERGKSTWECVCSCGKIIETTIGLLTSGDKQSCGCLQADRAKEKFTKHGLRHTTEYNSWANMKSRCLNKQNPNYPMYGGKGIEIAQEFIDSFEAFLSEIGEKPKDGKQYSIDRIDNTNGYIHGNIRWATKSQQNQNQGMKRINTSGVTGVHWHMKQNTTYAVAQWNGLDGRRCSMSFNTKKYGLLESFAMAVQWRKKMIQNLNEQGADYSCNHGM